MNDSPGATIGGVNMAGGDVIAARGSAVASRGARAAAGEGATNVDVDESKSRLPISWPTWVVASVGLVGLGITLVLWQQEVLTSTTAGILIGAITLGAALIAVVLRR